MRSEASIRVILIIAGLLVLAACERHITSEDPARTIPDVGPPPSNITLQINDESITMSWTMTGNVGVVRYRIYRSDASGLNFLQIDSTATTQITIDGLSQNVLHLFQIVPVLSSGMEGERSEIISARLTPLSIVINAGNEFTNSRNIQVQVNSSVAAANIRISEDPNFNDAVYETYAALQGFNLSEGDGTKTVYVDLIFSDGSSTGAPLSDVIILDTEAKIDSVKILSGSQTYGNGDTVVFALYSEEINGLASVSFANRGTVLLDDGSDFDLTADDGIYSGFFEVPADFNAFNAVVTGSLTDAANNQAPTLSASSYLTAQTPPQPVQLSALAVGPSQINLTWTRSTSTDFAAYRLYRSNTASVNESSELLTTVTNASVTTFTDTDVMPGNEYFYAVLVENTSGLRALSSVDSATTAADPVPDPVSLSAAATALNVADLSWSISTADDFAYYRIYRGINNSVSDQDVLVAEITVKQQAALTYNFPSASNYWYRIYVVDIHGQYSTGSTPVSPN